MLKLISSDDLELEGQTTFEWKTFRCALINSGVQLQARPDVLKWTGGDSSGQITVKNVYEATEAKYWNFSIGGWRKTLWSWECPLKIKAFYLAGCENKILTWENLQHRGHSGPSLCYLCKNSKENTLHLFVECPFTIAVWDRIKSAIKHITGWNGTSVAECFKNWKAHNKSYPTLSAFICWYIWLERNYAIFEDGNPSLQKVVYKTLSVVGDYKIQLKAFAPRKILCLSAGGGTVGWFDGAAQQSGQNSGAGGVIRVNDHQSYKWFFNCGPGTNTRAELLGVWALLTLASRLSISDLLVQGDSKIVIEWLQGKGRLQVVSLECWKDRILEIIKHFRKISFTHVFREGNQEADSLSKQALKKDPGKIAYYLCEEGHEGPHMFLNLF
jgi:ribonuclease HI